MKLGKIVVVVAVLAVALTIAGSHIAAQVAETSPKQLLDEAKKLYAAHNYDGALKRLQQIKRPDLGFFEKGSYDSLLDKTQKAVTGKAISICPERWPAERLEAEKLDPQTDYDRLFRLRVISDRDQIVKHVRSLAEQLVS